MILGSGLTTVCQQILLPMPRSLVALRYGSSRKLIQIKRRPSQVCKLERISTLSLNNVSSHRQAHGVTAATQLASPSGLLPGAPMLPKEEKRVKGVEGGSGRTKPATWDSLQLVFLSSSFSLPPPPLHRAARVSLLCLKPSCLIKCPHVSLRLCMHGVCCLVPHLLVLLSPTLLEPTGLLT